MVNKEDIKSKSYQDYMDRVSHETIPVYQPSMGDSEIENLRQVVQSNWISEDKG